MELQKIAKNRGNETKNRRWKDSAVHFCTIDQQEDFFKLVDGLNQLICLGRNRKLPVEIEDGKKVKEGKGTSSWMETKKH